MYNDKLKHIDYNIIEETTPEQQVRHDTTHSKTLIPYGPFGKGTDGFRNMLLWMMQNTPKKTMEVMKQWGYKPKVIPKNIPKSPFEGFKPTIVPKKPTTLGDALKTGKHTKVPTPKNLTPKTKIEDLQIGPHIDKQGRVWPKFVKPKPKFSIFARG